MGAISGGQTSAVYLLPGMSVKIKAMNHFVETKEVEHVRQDGSVEELIPLNGFVIDDTVVGELTAGDGPEVIYKHKMFEYNMITFYARTGEKGQVAIMSVPIHDHSSIVAGGPAYATYFSDDETVTNEI